MKLTELSIGIPIIHLLKGIVYREQEQVWPLLVNFRSDIVDYLGVIGLELIIEDSEGYAFVRQLAREEDQIGIVLPKLVDKRALSFQLTVMVVLLRKRLLESDLQGNESRTVLSFTQIADMVSLFYSDGTTNERKQEDKVQENINKLIRMGFLRKLKNEDDKYEVSRIINAFIEIEKLKEIEEKLRAYKEKVIKSDKEDESAD